MAINKLTKVGYGQLELNQVAFRRDGRIEAQCALDATDFASIPAENGMVLCVDNATRTIKLPTSGNVAKYPVAINYSAEHLYDEAKMGLKDFALTKDSGFYPRLGYLEIGDKFCTNTICYDTTAYATEAALKTAIAGVATTPVYASVNANGYWQIVASKPASGLAAAVVAGTSAGSMPDGQYAVKLQIIQL